jgi:hypothetical protein
MHEGALAPADVFRTMPSEIKVEDNMDSYLKRLICVVTGRFVLIDRTGSGCDDDLQSSSGKPEIGQRYRWRYWDNLGNVYDDHGNEWRAEFNSNNMKDWDDMIEDAGVLPVDFRTGLRTWMRYDTTPNFGSSFSSSTSNVIFEAVSTRG